MYNNPMYYHNFIPYQAGFNNNNFLNKGLLNFKKINWSNLLNNTQKTLNVINQAIPVYYQVKPIWGNAKTMFRMIDALKNDNNTTNTILNSKEEKNTSKGPVFFI